MALRGRGGASSGAFINLHVFRRENHFLQPLGECVHGHVRRDLQQRAPAILRFSSKQPPPISLYTVSAFSILFPPTINTL